MRRGGGTDGNGGTHVVHLLTAPLFTTMFLHYSVSAKPRGMMARDKVSTRGGGQTRKKDLICRTNTLYAAESDVRATAATADGEG